MQVFIRQQDQFQATESLIVPRIPVITLLLLKRSFMSSTFWRFNLDDVSLVDDLFLLLKVVLSDSILGILISLTLTADSATLLLSPMLVQFQQPIWEEFSVKRDDNKAKSLILEGCVEVLNEALQSVQYLGQRISLQAQNLLYQLSS